MSYICEESGSVADLRGAPPLRTKIFLISCSFWGNPANSWILRARDRDRDILARLRFGHQRPLNRRCPDELGHQRPVNRGCPRVSKPVSQDIQSICYCLHTGIFSSGHLRFSGRWCPNLNLAKISLSLSRLKSTHANSYVGTPPRSWRPLLHGNPVSAPALPHLFLLGVVCRRGCPIANSIFYFWAQKSTHNSLLSGPR